MDRVELEIRLNDSRVKTLRAFAELSPADLLRGATRSEHDPSTFWTPKDHLAHLAGIEKNFNRMIRRHLAGETNPVGLREDGRGQPRPREAIMAMVHEMTEAWVRRHQHRSFVAIVALGQAVRAETLALLAALTDQQLAEPLPGAPWADGTIGGVLGTNAAHATTHWGWLTAGLAGTAAG